MGNVLEDGDFEFTIQVTDAGCNPFSSTTAAFKMSVGVGEITVVGATQDGNPFLIPAGDEAYNPDHPALPPRRLQRLRHDRADRRRRHRVPTRP